MAPVRTFVILFIFSVKIWAFDQPTPGLNEVPLQLEVVQTELQKSGFIKSDCSVCGIESEADKKVDLIKDEINIGTPYYYKSNQYTLLLKRTAETPKKVTLKFKNGHTVCGRSFVGTSGYGNGNIFVECMIKYTEFEDEEMELNFKNLPPLKSGEEQLIKINLTKPKPEVSFYEIDSRVLESNDIKIKKSKMFFNSGHELKFSH
jgi:hypothetical protein